MAKKTISKALAARRANNLKLGGGMTREGQREISRYLKNGTIKQRRNGMYRSGSNG